MSGKDGNISSTIAGAPPELDRMAVKISHLDRLLALTGEIIITASNISILQRHLNTSINLIDKSSMDMVKNAALTSNRISSDLHHLVMDIRMVPIKDTFLRFRRLVRDIAKKRGRQVNFEIVGEDTLVDKTVAEKLYEPIAHQIRNAIDHGLEDPLERQHAGKDPNGQLVLSAYKKEGFTYVSVSDDGKGLDSERIRKVALDKGLISQTIAANLNDDDSLKLIMQPGFSTNFEATEISGRGVGMDVVKNTVEELGGEVNIETVLGRGSIFTYKIPQLSAVNITDALIIRAGESFCAIPIGNVVATQSFNSADIVSAMEKSESIQYLGSIIPLYDLTKLLSGFNTSDVEQDSLPVIIIDAKNGRIALKVSEFIRPQKLVLIPLPEIFSVKGVSGTTILGGNQLGIVLDPTELIALATGRLVDVSEAGALISVSDDEPSLDLSWEESAKSPEKLSEYEQGLTQQLELDGAVAEEFFVEISEILTALNEDIFQLEKDPENLSRINTIFRHFHSIKGNFIMTGFASAGAFVHELESVLDRLREKEIEITPEIIDLLLDAVKDLENGLSRVRAGYAYEVSDQDLLAQVARYRRQESKTPDNYDDSGDNFRLSALANILYYANINSTEKKLYQSLIKIGPSSQDPSLLVYLILKRLAVVAELLDTVPSLEKIEKGLPVNSFKVMFYSNYSLEEINRFFERQLQRLYSVSDFENMQMK